jgi:hypothetical protein
VTDVQLLSGTNLLLSANDRLHPALYLPTQLHALLARLQQWAPEVKHFCPGVPIILIGCKKDLRDDPETIEELKKTNEIPVTPEEVRCFVRSCSLFGLLTVPSCLLSFSLCPHR